jgi:hypothetical protein
MTLKFRRQASSSSQPCIDMLGVPLLSDLSAIALSGNCGHSAARQVELYEAWNKRKEAGKWRAKLPQAEAVEE